MESGRLTIGALAARTLCSVPTIRYYEEIGLVPPASRAVNGRRYYSETDELRLVFIKRCRDFGFPIEQVRDLVSIFEDGDRSCSEVRDLAQDHLTQVRAKLEQLRQLEANLSAFVQSCDEACIGGSAQHCTIIEDLSSQRATGGGKACCSGARADAGESASGFNEVRRV